MTAKLAGAAVPLLVSLGGVALAAIGLFTVWSVPLAMALPVAAAGLVADRVGRRLVRARPQRAIPWLEGWILFPASIAALGAGSLIFLAVAFEPFEGASTETKKLLAATAAALTTFVTTTIVKGAESSDEHWVSGRVSEAFHVAFDGCFASNTDGDLALNADGWRGLNGWGRDARRGRAEVIARNLPC